jgi:hypothetical protein
MCLLEWLSYCVMQLTQVFKINFYPGKVSKSQLCGIECKEWENEIETENENRLMEAETSSCSPD